MADLTMLTQIIADEAFEAELATAAALDHLRTALTDGEFTPDEAARAVEMLETALQQAQVAKDVSSFAYKRYRFAETLLREAAEDVKAGHIDWSRHRRGIARDAGFRQMLDAPDNVIAFPDIQDDAPAVG